MDEDVEGFKVGDEHWVVRLVEGATGEILARVHSLLQLSCLRLPGSDLYEEFIQKGYQLFAGERPVHDEGALLDELAWMRYLQPLEPHIHLGVHGLKRAHGLIKVEVRLREELAVFEMIQRLKHKFCHILQLLLSLISGGCLCRFQLYHQLVEITSCELGSCDGCRLWCLMRFHI